MTLRSRFVCIALTVAAGALACGSDSFFGSGDGGGDADGGTTSGDGGDASTADGSAVDGSSSSCPLAYDAGPTMVALPGTSMCIDSTEVTSSDYSAFLSAIAAGYAPVIDKRCTYKAVSGFEPDSLCAAESSSDGQLPQTCVDWCDAITYCQWAGKELCGPAGGVLGTYGDSIVSSKDPWERACTANDTRDFPYGPTYVSGACNVSGDGGATGLKEVASTPSCVGGYAGIFDMAGNAYEWVDFCDEGDSGVQAAACAMMGGSYERNDGIHASGRCIDVRPGLRNSVSADVGFRCCAQ